MKAPPEKKQATVMVVDDDRSVRFVARQALAQIGVRVDEADCGEAALEAFEAHRPDLMLLDVNMPGIDGFEVCRRVRGTAAGGQTPLLIMTATDDLDSIRRAYEAGATDFVVKPVQWPILSHRVRYMLRASWAAGELKKSQAKLEKAQELAHLGWWELDRSTHRMLCSDETLRILGLKRQDFQERLEQFIERVDPTARSALRDALDTALRTRTPQNLEYRLRHPDGSQRIVYQQTEPFVPDGNGELRLLGTIQDITDLRKAEDTIRYLAHYDRLTGLPNRSLFRERLEGVIDRARRRKELAAVLSLDLDQFKRINDTLGHDAGDRLLSDTGARLAGALRKTDLVARPDDSLVARFGGDEFIMLLDEIRRAEDAARVARRLFQGLSKPFRMAGHDVVVTASIGIAIYPVDGTDADTLLKNADTAMYHAKEQGRNNFQFFTTEMNASAFSRLMLEQSLHRALERDEFRLHFQPQIELASGAVVGAEALLRWNHPELGSVSPVEFIPIAEEAGLIGPIGDWVLRTACERSRAWHADGVDRIRIAVNVSARQFAEPGFADKVADRVAECGLDPALIDLELTESVLMNDVDSHVVALEHLKERGFRLSIDDFGTGYSSLAYLKKFPIDCLKIDRSFVREAPDDTDNRSIIAAIVALASQLGLAVVAEGVENVRQLDFLRELRCDEAQGYLVARPMPEAEFLDFLQRYGTRGWKPDL